MSRARIVAATAAISIALLAGCGAERPVLADAGPPPGTEGASCYPNGTCNAGLSCAAGRCVRGRDAGVDRSLPTDGAPTLPDGYPTTGCTTPGLACSLPDPCAINPLCGVDRVCRPAKLLACDDGLACTDDSCQGLGLCAHAPKPGSCAIDDACWSAGERNPKQPCKVCEPSAAPRSWSSANGGACDDGNACTKDDYCQAGSCKGTYYGATCSDSLACTDDGCDGKGGCLPPALKAGWCLIAGACYQDGEQDPGGCKLCDVKKSQTAWTPLGGVFCTIAGQCHKPGAKDPTQCSVCDPTKNDKDWTPLPGLCKIGSACYQKGAKAVGGCAECDPAVSATAWTVIGDSCLINNVCYKTGDKDPTGCSACEPAKSKTAWTSLASTCLIAGKCYAAGAKDPTACGECDPAASTTSWTVKGASCLIAGVCYQPQQTDASGCGVCDPAKSKTSWTPVAGKCQIGGVCYADQAKDKSGCLLCDVAKSQSSWTPLPGATAVSYGFESGQLPAGWTVTNSNVKVGWTVTAKRPGAGAYSLYYGDPVAGNYDTPSTANSGTATLPPVTLTAGKKAGLSFLLWMDTESGASFDELELYAGTTKLWAKDSATVPKMKAWIEVVVDLSSYAGQAVTLSLKFDTSDSISNSTEGVYVDNLTIYHGC
jgi:hypothetical protein